MRPASRQDVRSAFRATLTKGSTSPCLMASEWWLNLPDQNRQLHHLQATNEHTVGWDGEPGAGGLPVLSSNSSPNNCCPCGTIGPRSQIFRFSKRRWKSLIPSISLGCQQDNIFKQILLQIQFSQPINQIYYTMHYCPVNLCQSPPSWKRICYHLQSPVVIRSKRTKVYIYLS